MTKEQSIIHRAKAVVCRHWRITRTELTRRTRSQHILWPRQVAMALARDQGVASHVIARAFAMDHATVLHATQVVSERASTNRHEAADVAAVRQLMAEAAV